MSAVSRLIASCSDSSVFFGSTTINSSQPVLSESAMLMTWSVDPAPATPAMGSSKERTSSCMRFNSSNANSLNNVRPVAVRFLEAVAQSDQFLPTINRDQPAVLQVAFELLGLNSKIDNIGVAPDKWMERLDVGDGRSVLSAAIELYRSCFTQLNRNDARHRVRTKEHPVLLQFHSKRFLDFARNNNSQRRRKVDRPLCWAMPNKCGFAATI